MKAELKRIGAGAIALLMLSALLIFSDRPSHRPSNRFRIALLQISGNAVMAETIRGIRAAFHDNGFIDGQNFDFVPFDPGHDLQTATRMAESIVRDRFDLVITLSTPALQIMANADRYGQINLLFGAVTDPIAAGVGIGLNEHPPWMSGIRTAQPVRETIRLARRMNPRLKVIGMIVNPQETNSRVCLKLARAAARELGMTLVEKGIKTPSQIPAAAEELLKQKVEAVFIGGDNTVELNNDVIISQALARGIPTFGFTPLHAGKNCLAGLGGNYFETGVRLGNMAIAILRGANPEQIPIENSNPLKLILNLGVLPRLTPGWNIPPEILESADAVIDAGGILHVRKHQPTTAAQQPTTSKKLPKEPWKLFFVNYNHATTADDNFNGFLSEMERMGKVPGRDFQLTTANAEGNMKKVVRLIRQARESTADLVLVTSTPVLLEALRVIDNKPVVFAVVGDPIRAGAGESATRHRPNFTGVSSMSDFDQMASFINRHFPDTKTVGTLFTPGELNSKFYCADFSRALAKYRIKLIAVPDRDQSEIGQSAHQLISRGIDMFVQISDNLHNANFDLISTACIKAKMPLFTFVMPNVLHHGAAIAIAPDYEDGGKEQAVMALKVLRGESPAEIPFRSTGKSRIVISLRNARQCGLMISPELQQSADLVVE